MIYNITPKRRRVLAAIHAYEFIHETSPTIRELADRCSISRTTTYTHMQQLLRDKFIKKDTKLLQPKYSLTVRGHNCLRGAAVDKGIVIQPARAENELL